MHTEGRRRFVERELEGLRKLYGAKFSAITAALGNVSEGVSILETTEDIEAALSFLREAERILVDA